MTVFYFLKFAITSKFFIVKMQGVHNLVLKNIFRNLVSVWAYVVDVISPLAASYKCKPNFDAKLETTKDFPDPLFPCSKNVGFRSNLSVI